MLAVPRDAIQRLRRNPLIHEVPALWTSHSSIFGSRFFGSFNSSDYQRYPDLRFECLGLPNFRTSKVAPHSGAAQRSSTISRALGSAISLGAPGSTSGRSNAQQHGDPGVDAAAGRHPADLRLAGEDRRFSCATRSVDLRFIECDPISIDYERSKFDRRFPW